LDKSTNPPDAVMIEFEIYRVIPFSANNKSLLYIHYSTD